MSLEPGKQNHQIRASQRVFGLKRVLGLCFAMNFFQFFGGFFRSQIEGSKIIDQCMKIESEVIELMTGWQLQDLLSWFSTELTLASG